MVGKLNNLGIKQLFWGAEVNSKMFKHSVLRTLILRDPGPDPGFLKGGGAPRAPQARVF